MSYSKIFIEDYLNGSKTIVLATVDEESRPVVRTLGGFAAKGFVTFFATAKGSDKVKHIEKNANVSLLFQHENQEISKFLNISVKGLAEVISDEKEFEDIHKQLLNRNPRLKAVTKETHNIYKVSAKEITILDFSKKSLEERKNIINL
ncbi:MAG: pyridoxamine 5'-phosphate oxidase family protein [Clostridiaceae bacterium]